MEPVSEKEYYDNVARLHAALEALPKVETEETLDVLRALRQHISSSRDVKSRQLLLPIVDHLLETLTPPALRVSLGAAPTGEFMMSDLTVETAFLRIERAPVSKTKFVPIAVLFLSIASFGVGLIQFRGSSLGAGLTFGGLILAYEALYLLFRGNSDVDH